MKARKWIVACAIVALSTTAMTSSAWAFQESPMLKEMVDAGSLPPVEERLPSKPTVVNALEVGK